MTRRPKCPRCTRNNDNGVMWGDRDEFYCTLCLDRRPPEEGDTVYRTSDDAPRTITFYDRGADSVGIKLPEGGESYLLAGQWTATEPRKKTNT